MEALHGHRLHWTDINEGIAVDARLVKSASHPRSKEKLEEEKKIRETPEGKLDKTGNHLKFSRDLESDWTVKNNTPHYGLKEHASVDTRYGFVLATEITPASFHDSPYLSLCVTSSCHTKNPIKKVYADKGCRFGSPVKNASSKKLVKILPLLKSAVVQSSHNVILAIDSFRFRCERLAWRFFIRIHETN